MGFINWALMSDYYAHESHELCVVVLWNYMELYGIISIHCGPGIRRVNNNAPIGFRVTMRGDHCK